MTVEIEVTVPTSGITVEIAQTGAAGPRGPQGVPGNDGATGPAGADGAAGAQGNPGLSAYEVAQLNGFLGTEAQWLASLHGADGATGAAGAQGIQGIQGPAGNDGATGATGAAGAAGVDGKTIRSGSGAPSSGLGVDGDFYIDTAADEIYGPKTSGAWGSPTSIVGPTGATGSAGATGATGAAGTNGTNGATWWQGSGAPSNGTGADGDFYFRTDTSDVYQRASGAYSIIANIKGATGATGATGSAGATGATGPAGAAGSTAGTDYTKTTASLANNATETGTWAPSSAQVHEVYKVTVDKAARVRFYDSTAHLTADASRAVGTDPTGDHGLLLEANLPVSGNLFATVAIPARIFEVSAFGAVPYSITNLSGTTGTVTVTLRAKGLV